MPLDPSFWDDGPSAAPSPKCSGDECTWIGCTGDIDGNCTADLHQFQCPLDDAPRDGRPVVPHHRDTPTISWEEISAPRNILDEKYGPNPFHDLNPDPQPLGPPDAP